MHAATRPTARPPPVDLGSVDIRGQVTNSLLWPLFWALQGELSGVPGLQAPHAGSPNNVTATKCLQASASPGVGPIPVTGRMGDWGFLPSSARDEKTQKKQSLFF